MAAAALLRPQLHNRSRSDVAAHKRSVSRVSTVVAGQIGTTLPTNPNITARPAPLTRSNTMTATISRAPSPDDLDQVDGEPHYTATANTHSLCDLFGTTVKDLISHEAVRPRSEDCVGIEDPQEDNATATASSRRVSFTVTTSESPDNVNVRLQTPAAFNMYVSPPARLAHAARVGLHADTPAGFNTPFTPLNGPYHPLDYNTLSSMPSFAYTPPRCAFSLPYSALDGYNQGQPGGPRVPASHQYPFTGPSCPSVAAASQALRINLGLDMPNPGVQARQFGVGLLGEPHPYTHDQGSAVRQLPYHKISPQSFEMTPHVLSTQAVPMRSTHAPARHLQAAAPIISPGARKPSVLHQGTTVQAQVMNSLSPQAGQKQPMAGHNHNLPPIVNTGHKGPMKAQPGDWSCLVCSFVNWRRRKYCMRCCPFAEGNAFLPPDVLLNMSAGSGEPIPAQQYAPAAMQQPAQRSASRNYAGQAYPGISGPAFSQREHDLPMYGLTVARGVSVVIPVHHGMRMHGPHGGQMQPGQPVLSSPFNYTLVGPQSSLHCLRPNPMATSTSAPYREIPHAAFLGSATPLGGGPLAASDMAAPPAYHNIVELDRPVTPSPVGSQASGCSFTFSEMGAGRTQDVDSPATSVDSDAEDTSNTSSPAILSKTACMTPVANFAKFFGEQLGSNSAAVDTSA